MQRCRPQDGLHVTLFGAKGAEQWVRHAYNIPADVGCWKPYRVLVQSYGGVSYTAFATIKEFKRWLGEAKLQLDPYHGEKWGKRAWVARFGRVRVAS